MSATFYERMFCEGDYLDDGDAIDMTQFRSALLMYDQGFWNAAALKTLFVCTTAQGTDLDAILATRPAVLLTILNGVARATWVDRIYGAAVPGRGGYESLTAAQYKTRIGV